MELLAGIDLHSNNGYLGIADMQGKRLYDKKLPINTIKTSEINFHFF
jgi:hypothetical protein